MHSHVVGELGVEGGAEDVALPDGDDLAFMLGDRFDAFAAASDHGGADKDPRYRLFQAFHGDRGLK